MAISPDQARKMTEMEKDTTDKIESFIDDFLRKNYNGGSITITPPAVLHLTKRIQEEIINRYNKVGWNVKMGNDQREGDEWFILEPK